MLNLFPVFFPLPLNFGAIVELPPPAGIDIRMHSYPYAVSVHDAPEFMVGCLSDIRKPFTADDLLGTLQRVVVALVARPDQRVSELAI